MPYLLYISHMIIHIHVCLSIKKEGISKNITTTSIKNRTNKNEGKSVSKLTRL